LRNYRPSQQLLRRFGFDGRGFCHSGGAPPGRGGENINFTVRIEHACKVLRGC
jgi:hypothetical protein